VIRSNRTVQLLYLLITYPTIRRYVLVLFHQQSCEHLGGKRKY